MPAILTAPSRRTQFTRAIAMVAFALLCGAAFAQERFSLFVPTDAEDVPRMLKLAGLKDGEVVYDLGSGDGRIVIEAAARNRTVRGRGIEIDGKLVRESRAAAEKRGVADRVAFLHQNAFDADLREADVIAMWLWPELMRMLRPKILAEARPGTRIVTRTWDLGAAWKPDAIDRDGAPLFLWVVPAKVEGYWNWTVEHGGVRRRYDAVLEQRFQQVEGVVRTGHRRGLLDPVTLRGDRLAFTLMMTLPGAKLVRHEFEGVVRGDAIVGTVRLHAEPFTEEPVTLPWRATRSVQSAYFAPTGLTAD